MSDNWRDDVTEERATIGLGALGEDPITVEFDDEGERVETKHGDALQIGARYIDGPDGYETMSGSELETGEEIFLMSSSARFQRALVEFAPSLTGERAEISAEGSGFDRTYRVE